MNGEVQKKRKIELPWSIFELPWSIVAKTKFINIRFNLLQYGKIQQKNQTKNWDRRVVRASLAPGFALSCLGLTLSVLSFIGVFWGYIRINGLIFFWIFWIFADLYRISRTEKSAPSPTGHYVSHNRLLQMYILHLRSFYSHCQNSQSRVFRAPFSSLLPPDLAALLRSAFFFTWALFFARMALSRSAYHNF